MSMRAEARRGPQLAIPAVFMRGGTSKGVFFHAHDLPDDPAERDRLFLAVIGSPDPYGRQLNGMGGGVSSLSKVVIIGPATRADADLDYTFGQVAVRQALVDYGSTCGNLASAVGPFALDEGLIAAPEDHADIRIHAVNTGKIIRARFGAVQGCAAVTGDLILPGVAGRGASVQLQFLDPGGASTGRLLPSGAPIDILEVPGLGAVPMSLIDAATPCVFVPAAALGLAGTELPTDLEANRAAMALLETIRCIAGVKMGLASSVDALGKNSPGSPKVAIVARPAPARLLDGTDAPAEAMDISVRMLSMGQAHRAIPLTGALCLAVAAGIDASVVAEATAAHVAAVRVGTPSGSFPVTADVRHERDWTAHSAGVFRTARRLMDGRVLIPRQS